MNIFETIEILNGIEISPIEIAGTIIGIVYLGLEYKASRQLWIAGFFMSLCYVLIFFNAKIYANMLIYVYYTLASVYGWLAWNVFSKSGKAYDNRIFTINKKQTYYSLVVFGVVFMVLIYLLKTFTDSDVWLIDSFITALSVIGMWMLARKFYQQWMCWIVVNLTSVGLCFVKEMYPTMILFALYTVVSVLGYFRWKKEYLKTVNDE